MKSLVSARGIFFTLLILGSHSLILCDFPRVVRDLNIKPRDFYIASSTVIGTAIACTIWLNKHHPAALAAKQLEIQQEEQRKKDRAGKEIEDQRKLVESQKLNALKSLERIENSYEAEIKLLPDDELARKKDAFLLTIKSKCNTHQAPLTYYNQRHANDLEELRNIDTNHLDTEKKSKLLQLIGKMERIQATFNLVMGDAQKAEQETAKVEKRKEEAEKRKIEKENLELQKIRLKIDNYHETEKTNAHIRTELRRMNERLDSVNTSLYNSELSNVTRAQQGEKNINQFKITIVNLHDAIVKAINGHKDASEAAAKELIIMLNEFKKYLETVGLIAITPRQPPYNPEALQPAPTYPLAQDSGSLAIQPIPVPRQ